MRSIRQPRRLENAPSSQVRVQVLVKKSPLHSRSLTTVVVSDINADAANHVVDEIQQLGGQAFACRCDITSEQELGLQTLLSVSWVSHILVNNAGGGGPKPFDMPMADFRRANELNVFSFFHLSQLVAPEMEKMAVALF